MEFLKTNYKKHPFVSAFLFWLYFLLAFGRYEVYKAAPINYLSTLLFGVILLLLEKRHISGAQTEKETAKRKLIQTASAIGAVTVYVEAMIFSVFDFHPFPGSVERNIFMFIFPALALCVFAALFITVKKKWTIDKAAVLLVASGFVIQIFYSMYGQTYQYDVEGHLNYINWLYNHYLPMQSNPSAVWQFYHPPLHHYICAAYMHIHRLFSTQAPNLEYIPRLYSLMSLVVMYKLTGELGIKGTPRLLTLTLLTFSPALIAIGGYKNNDMLSVFFLMLSVYLSVKWYKNRTTKNIIKVAVSFGLGMLTKLSVWMAAVPIAVLFIAALVETLSARDKKQFGKTFGMMCVFMLIAAPLSLYWSLRNYFRFGMSLGFIPESINPDQEIRQSITQRLFDFSPFQYTGQPWQCKMGGDQNDPYNEYNPLIALIKSSAQGYRPAVSIEHQVAPFMWIVLYAAAFICLISFVCFVCILIKKNTLSWIYKLFIAALFATVLLSYYVFCIRYPQVCTEEIRYAFPLVYISALSLGAAALQLQKKNSLYRKGAVYCLYGSAALFSAAVIVKCIAEYLLLRQIPGVGFN